jgi:hypothetical protein
MAITEIWRSQANAGTSEDLTVLDYDDVVQCVGITLTNGTPGVPADGHGTLSLAAPTPANIIASVNTDQFNDGQRHVLAGPGATGVDDQGKALPTVTIASSTVARIIPVKGQTNTAFVSLTWHP